MRLSRGCNVLFMVSLHICIVGVLRRSGLAAKLYECNAANIILYNVLYLPLTDTTLNFYSTAYHL